MASINPTVLDCKNSPHVSGKTDNHVRLTITGITQNIATNKTTVNWKITVQGTPWTTLYALYVSLGGKVLYDHHTGGEILSGWSNGQVIKSGTTEFTNNDDGSLTLSAYIKQMFYYGNGDTTRWTNSKYYQENSTNMVCSTIPRTSEATLSASELNVGETIKITTNRKATSLTHKIYYSISGSTETCLNSSVGDEYSWTIPKTIANKITSSDNATMKFRVVTVYNNNDIGSCELNLKVKVPTTSEFQPTISSVALSEVVKVPTSWGFFIQNLSKIKGVVSAGGAYGSTISSYSVSLNNESFISSTFTTSTITLVNPTIKVTVKDTRGRTATYTSTVNVIKYQVPTITNFTSYRNASDPTKIDISFSCSIYKLNSKNTSSFVFYYKNHKDSEYSSISIDVSKLIKNETTDTIVYSGTLSMVSSDSQTSYDTHMEAKDYFNTIPSKDSFVNTVFKLININAKKTAFAIGKLHEVEGHIENALPQINYENIIREVGDYKGLVLSCPSIEDGKMTFNSSTNKLEFLINGETYEITLTKK